MGGFRVGYIYFGFGNFVFFFLGVGYGSYGYGGNSAIVGYSKCAFFFV